MKKTHYIIFALLTLLACKSFAADISSSVDRNEISVDETVQLSVRVSPQSNATPDFSQLNQQFDILGKSQNSQYRNINGQIEAFSEWNLILAPKKTGKLLIPSFQYKGVFSDAIVLTVNAANNPINGAAADLFLELEVDKSEVYVQQQVLVKVRLYTSVALRIDEAPELAVDGTNVIALDNTQYQKILDNRNFSVTEFSYALFPQQSGTIIIPAQSYTVSIRSSNSRQNRFGFNQTETRRLRSKEQIITVKPQANSTTNWLPAQSVELRESWSKDPLQLQVGDAVTRTVVLTAKGLNESQLPPLNIPAVAAIKDYPEQPTTQQQGNANGIVATRTQTIAIVPTQSGEFILPSVELAWWNTATDQEETASLPARKLIIAANPSSTKISTPASAPAAPSADKVPEILPNHAVTSTVIWWQLACTLLGIGNLLTLWLLWRKRQTQNIAASKNKPTQTSSAVSVTIGELRSLCKQAQHSPLTSALAKQILAAVELWSRGMAAGSLQQRLTTLNNIALSQEIENLNRFIYGNNQQQQFDSQKLLQSIELLTQHLPATKAEDLSALAPIYPTQ